MEYPVNISIKVEKDDLERDSNDNFEQLLLDASVKVEKDGLTEEHQDWCIPNFGSPGDLLEPLFFKKLTEPEAEKCAICNRYFSDSNSILKHNVTHLRVLITNPRLYQCDHCSAFFTDRHKINRHVKTHLRYKNPYKNNAGLTYLLSYKPKAYTEKKGLLFNERYGNTYKPKPKIVATERKLHDGVTNKLQYKPKASKLNTLKDHKCNICRKSFTYKSWHSHMKQVHGDGGYFCGICKMEFKCERYFLRHMKKKHTEHDDFQSATINLKIQCDQCDTVLQSKYALKTHKRNVHSVGEFVCTVCKSKLKCKSYLLTHMRRVHYNDGKMHLCECGKKFRSPRYLKVHKKNAHSKK